LTPRSTAAGPEEEKREEKGTKGKRTRPLFLFDRLCEVLDLLVLAGRQPSKPRQLGDQSGPQVGDPTLLLLDLGAPARPLKLHGPLPVGADGESQEDVEKLNCKDAVGRVQRLREEPLRVFSPGQFAVRVAIPRL
jgi:hypothetical protein